METRKVFDIFISVILAIILWFYVINVVNPPSTATVQDINVQLTGMEVLNNNGLTIAGDGNYTVDITISAPRNELAGISSSNFVASSSVANLGAGQNYITVNVTGPDNITISDIRSQKIQVYVDELVSEEKPLDIAYTEPAGDYEVTVLDAEYETLRVKGAKSLVDMVTEVRVDIDVSQLEIDIPQTENLMGIALDKEGNIVASVEIEDSSIAVTSVLYKIKSVPFRLSFFGTPGLGAEVDTFTYPNRINIKASSSMLEIIELIQGKAINIEGITQDSSYRIEPILPDTIYLAKSSETLWANVKLVHTGEISFSYASGEVQIDNLPSDWTMAFEDPDALISVTAKGDLDVIRTLEASDLQPRMDLAGYDSGLQRVVLKAIKDIDGIEISVNPEFAVVTLSSPEDLIPPDEGGEEDDPSQQTDQTEEQTTEVNNNG